MAAASAAALSKLGYDGFLACVDSAIHRGHPVGYLEEVAQIPSLGVYAPPHLDGVEVDEVGELFVDDLMLLPGQPRQVAHQQRLLVGGLVVRPDDRPRDPQHQLRVLTAPAQVLGEFDHLRVGVHVNVHGRVRMNVQSS
ncbi:hypothetical protein ACIQNG_38530 [Streptomyces sp. NPDC091377]|uniref:hypothetical protein n=1 Tax=Streptomyces sp. NPDC091377 TaxID=3365995 RepID=UPI003820753C